MGIFNFLKKSKSDYADMGMELPPIPKLEGFGSMDMFPEMKQEEIPPLPETLLPPLPTETPAAVPPAPQEMKLEAPKVELPKAPTQEMPAPRMIETPAPQMIQQMPEPPEPMHEEEPSQRPEFPSLPQMQPEDVVPDRIPPLEGLPEPPEFATSPAREVPREMPMPRIEPSELPHSFLTPEEPFLHRRRMPAGPLFIRTDQFRSAIESIEIIRSKFSEEDDLFFRVSEIKNAQDQKYEEFKQSLEDMQRKLLFIDKSLFEPR